MIFILRENRRHFKYRGGLWERALLPSQKTFSRKGKMLARYEKNLNSETFFNKVTKEMRRISFAEEDNGFKEELL